jgi:hypothetical protein
MSIADRLGSEEKGLRDLVDWDHGSLVNESMEIA